MWDALKQVCITAEHIQIGHTFLKQAPRFDWVYSIANLTHIAEANQRQKYRHSSHTTALPTGTFGPPQQLNWQ